MLLKEYRAVILAEAGSGKTVEISNAAKKLRKQNKFAFFLRLENMPETIEKAFEVGTFEEFKEWLSSGEEGWLLLDSVDEARLRHPLDFQAAIRTLSREINAAKDRAHIIITGRTTAWRPKTDLAFCTSQLPFASAVISESNSPTEGDDDDEHVQTNTNSEKGNTPTFSIFALDNLTTEQVALFVKTRGVNDNQAFVEEVERADAWSFTTRPQDLEELTEFWIDNKRIGARLELMQNSIDRRLSERDENRKMVSPLSSEQTRQGARLLAAATMLTQDPNIGIPDGMHNSKGITIKSLLPGWNDQDHSTLLSRPIFDAAIYGAVRFHHRTVREYLAAEWFSELLKRNTSRHAIEALFFQNQYGVDIVVPTMRPILPWLAILDEKIRERVRKVAPEIIFEGGDPSCLPVDVRRYILREVCEKIANSVDDRSARDYAAVQRFANIDLTEDVRQLLKKHADNHDVMWFLLRMVWTGRLTGALPEVMEAALSETLGKYGHLAAYKAVKAIGSIENLEQLRKSFLASAPELNRERLAELIEGTSPTQQTVEWLLMGLAQCAQKEKYSVDHLTDAVTGFFDVADIELLPLAIVGLNRLLSLPPTIERHFCEVSDKFQWLILPAARAVERLTQDHHEASLERDSLSILHKVMSSRRYGTDHASDIKTEFSEIVPAWKELNRALFWFEVDRSREAIDKKRNERLTSFWQARAMGSFWRFDKTDFPYIANEISSQTFPDDKLVSLSVAFSLYVEAGRTAAWRALLKKLAAGNSELSDRLNTLLRPPAQDKQSRSWKKLEAKWKKQGEANQRKEAKNATNWSNYLHNELDKAKAALEANPGVPTNTLHYLYSKTLDSKLHSTRWSGSNWKSLAADFGEEVARFYRDSVVAIWRQHVPKLRSEGAPMNQTAFSTIIGLAGLQIEARETQNWPGNLDVNEVELACKYASFELNGFPTWFPKLFEQFPEHVGNFLMREIQFELDNEKPDLDLHYLINDMSWSGQWAWNRVAQDIYELLKKADPKNLSSLDKLLKVLQGSNLSDTEIELLAAKKCRELKEWDHLARWFAVWAGVAPKTAIESFEAQILEIADSDARTQFAMTFVTNLFGGRRDDGSSVRQHFKTPIHMKRLFLLMHEHIRLEEDVDRLGKGAYSPELRDNAQDARNTLFDLLSKIPGKESYLALMEIATSHRVAASRPWALHLAKIRAEQDGDLMPWSTTQVKEFHETLERTPSSHEELAKLAIFRLLDLKKHLEDGDSSIAGILRTVTDEKEIRKFIGGELSEKSHGRYSIPQEEELADAKRIDLRFHGVGFYGPVPAELKLADNWTGPKLFERLENQLCGDYLRDSHSYRGIFVLVYRGAKRGWDIPDSENRVDFDGLLTALQSQWERLSSKFPNVDDITVVGIDLTKRSG